MSGDEREEKAMVEFLRFTEGLWDGFVSWFCCSGLGHLGDGCPLVAQTGLISKQ